MNKPRIGILHSTVRIEEKLIVSAAQKRNVGVELVDVRNQIFNPKTYKANFDLALVRTVSTTKGMCSARFLESQNILVINSPAVSAICEDKFLTSLALEKSGVPAPKFALVFDVKQAQKAVEELGGFPIVAKPVIGSWGRLLAKINDIDCLEAVIEHKNILGSPQQKVVYLQQYIEKPGRDIRCFVLGGKTICAIYRDSPHWITNTALGGQASNCGVTSELADICRRASEAVGGGILAIDIFETKNGLTVNEINHTMEFKNSETPTGVSISEAIIDYCLDNLKQL